MRHQERDAFRPPMTGPTIPDKTPRGQVLLRASFPTANIDEHASYKSRDTAGHGLGQARHRSSAVRALAVLATVAALAIAGCGSTTTKPKPAASSTGNAFLAYDKQLTVALVSCFYRLHLIPKSAAKGPPPLPVHDGQVATSTPADHSTILLWFAGIGEVLPVQGISMGAWLGDSAQDPSDWPASKCGKIPPPSS